MSNFKYADRKKLNSFLFNNRQLAAVASKPFRSTGPSLNQESVEYARQHSDRLAMATDIHSEFGKLFFDLDVAVEILIGLMLSPKGTVKPELIFSCNYNALPPSALGSIIKDLPGYFDDNYRLSSGLSTMLKKVLYSNGAVARLIIPESLIDKIVNTEGPLTQEALSFITAGSKIPLKGIMHNTASPLPLTAESFNGGGFSYAGMSHTMEMFNLTITDNFDLLTVPKLRQYISQRQTEAYISPFATTIDQQWGFEMQEDQLDLSNVTPDRTSIGFPFYLEVDSGSIAPIHIPGDPSKHTGYLLVLDENGYVVSPKDLRSDIEAMAQELPSTPMGKSLASTAKTNLGTFSNKGGLNTDRLLDIFTSQVNSQIQKMLLAGGQSRDLTFTEVNASYAAVLARALKGRHTRILFLPVEMVAYYAFEFDDSGVGVTLLHDLPTLSSMRASLLFSGLVSEVKNNIPQTKVNITLDENDPDPDSSIEMIQSSTLERQANMMPIGLVNITDWTDWAHRSGFSFQVEEHPRLPNTKIEYEDVTPQRMIPSESNLYANIRGQQIMAIGITPEMVDNGYASDFATTDQAKRIQLARRIAARQMTLSDLITGEVRKISIADGNVLRMVTERVRAIDKLETFLSDKYKAMYRKNKELTIEKIALEVIRKITVSLPNPDTDNIDIILANIQKFGEALDLAIDSWFNEGFFNGSEEEQQLADNATAIRTAIKAHYMRKYMIKNGYLTELAEMVSFSDKGTPLIDLEEEMSSHIKGLIAMTSNYLRNFKPVDPPITEKPVDEEMDIPVDEDSEEEFGATPEADVGRNKLTNASSLMDDPGEKVPQPKSAENETREAPVTPEDSAGRVNLTQL